MATTLRSENGLSLLQFDILKQHKKITHAFFTREGGISQSPYHSLNVSLSCGDDENIVTINKQKVKNTIEYIHGSKVVLTRPMLEHGIEIKEITPGNCHALHTCDVMVTKYPNIALMITHADCQAAFIYDPIQHVVANIHSGWRGNVQNIYQTSVEYLKRVHHSKPENLIACIGPSLGPESSQFLNYKTELPSSFLDFQIKPLYFDLWAISQHQLIEAGLKPEHVQVAKIDTFKDPNFFSYRRDKPTGRNPAIVVLA
jgi:polyphenol oxidase